MCVYIMCVDEINSLHFYSIQFEFTSILLNRKRGINPNALLFALYVCFVYMFVFLYYSFGYCA